jgi:anti-sigma B factor antagonist
MAHLSTRWAGDIAIVTPRGYLMGGTETDELAEKVDELLAGGNRKLVIDLIETAHMNSTALGVMNRAHHRYREQGGQIRLCHLTDRIENALVITRLSLIFDVYETERAAIEAFHAPATS